MSKRDIEPLLQEIRDAIANGEHAEWVLHAIEQGLGDMYAGASRGGHHSLSALAQEQWFYIAEVRKALVAWRRGEIQRLPL